MKFIAALCMLIDHIGLIFFPSDIRWRIIGRLAMPIFAYGIARGAFYTTSLKRYMKKMLLFSFVSQIPFWGMHYLDSGEAFFDLHLNIGFTFWIALWCIDCLQMAGIVPLQFKTNQIVQNTERQALSRGRKAMTIIVVLISIVLADIVGCDYGSYGVIIVLMGYMLQLKGGSLVHMALFYLVLTALFFGQNTSLCLLQSIGVMSYSIIYGARHIVEKRWSRFFYWFYPLHMALIVMIRWLQVRN